MMTHRHHDRARPRRPRSTGRREPDRGTRGTREASARVAGACRAPDRFTQCGRRLHRNGQALRARRQRGTVSAHVPSVGNASTRVQSSSRERGSSSSAMAARRRYMIMLLPRGCPLDGEQGARRSRAVPIRNAGSARSGTCAGNAGPHRTTTSRQRDPCSRSAGAPWRPHRSGRHRRRRPDHPLARLPRTPGPAGREPAPVRGRAPGPGGDPGAQQRSRPRVLLRREPGRRPVRAGEHPARRAPGAALTGGPRRPGGLRGRDLPAAGGALVAHCRSRSAGSKCPRSIYFRSDPQPLSGAGRILKTELRTPYRAHTARTVG